MKLIIVDDQGDQLVLADEAGGLDVLTKYPGTVGNAMFDNSFYCEKCERTLLLSKMSREPDTCVPCLREEYSRGE